MKLSKLNAIIHAIVCGSISLSFSPLLHGQQFGNQYNSEMNSTYVPANPSSQMPLVEREIPGSARNLGPVSPQHLTPPSVGPIETSSVYPFPNSANGIHSPTPAGEIIVSEDLIFDGKTVFPLGTFPQEGFGEKIISQTPASQTNEGMLIPGTLEPALQSTSRQQFEGAEDIVEVTPPEIDLQEAPDEIPESLVVDEESFTTPSPDAPAISPADSAAQSLNELPSVSVVENPADLAFDDQANQELSVEDENDVAKKTQPASNGQATENLKLQKLSKRHQRLKDRLAEANKTTDRLRIELKAARQTNSKIEKNLADAQADSEAIEARLSEKLQQSEMALEQAKVTAVKNLEQQEESLASLRKELTEAKQAAKALKQNVTKQAKVKQQEMAEKIAGLSKELKQAKNSSSKLKQSLRSAKEQLAESKAALAAAKSEAETQMAAMSAKLAATKAAAESANLGVAAAAEGAKTSESDDATGADESNGAAQSQAEIDRKKREAAKAEVKRKLAQREAELKNQQSEADSTSDAAGEMQGQPGQPAEPTLNPLERKIKDLKSKRDQLIVDAESRIREKQQSGIDQLIADGNAIDSDVVVAAKDRLADAVKSSREKLKSRYRRKIERLKQTMGK